MGLSMIPGIMWEIVHATDEALERIDRLTAALGKAAPAVEEALRKFPAAKDYIANLTVALEQGVIDLGSYQRQVQMLIDQLKGDALKTLTAEKKKEAEELAAALEKILQGALAGGVDQGSFTGLMEQLSRQR